MTDADFHVQDSPETGASTNSAVSGDTTYAAHDRAAATSADPHAADERLDRLARDANALKLGAPIPGVLEWINGRARVHVVRLAAAIEDGTRFRTGPDGTLYHYANGVYLPNGEEVVRLRAQTMLASMYRSQHVNEVVRFYLDREGFTPLSFDPDEALVLRSRDGIVNVHTWTTEAYAR